MSTEVPLDLSNESKPKTNKSETKITQFVFINLILLLS